MSKSRVFRLIVVIDLTVVSRDISCGQLRCHLTKYRVIMIHKV